MRLYKTQITKALIRLRGCAGWFAPVLFANPRRQVFLCRGPKFCVLCLVLLIIMRLFIAALWPLAGKGLTSWLLLMMYFYYFLMWYLGSGVVLDCIVSWSLPPFLLSKFSLCNRNIKFPEKRSFTKPLIGSFSSLVLGVYLVSCNLLRRIRKSSVTNYSSRCQSLNSEVISLPFEWQNQIFQNRKCMC